MLCTDLAHGGESRAVDCARPELLERAQMLRRAVAEVLIEAVLRIAPVQPAHESIAANLREDRRGADLGQQGVAVDARLRAIETRALAKPGDLPAVDADELRDSAHLEHGALHREQRRLQNVDAVDLRMARECDRESLRAAANLHAQPQPLRL